MEQGGQKHFGNQGRGPNHKGHPASPNQPSPPLSPHTSAAHTNFRRDPSFDFFLLLSPLRQVRPGQAPAGREIQRETAASRSSSPLQKRLEASGREPAAAQRRGGNARGQWRRWRPPPTLCSPPRAAPSLAPQPSPSRSRVA